MPEKLETTREEPLDVKIVFNKLSSNGKRLFLGMSHFGPETGGNQEAVLATCAMDEDRFQRAAGELKQTGLLVQGTLGTVRPAIPIKSVDIEDLTKVLTKCLEEGSMDQGEADSVQRAYWAHVDQLKVGERIRFSIPAKKGIKEDPKGNRYALKRYGEVQKFLEESGISSR